MAKNQDIFAGINNLFPEEIKVYKLAAPENETSKESFSFLHKHFRAPLAEEAMKQLVWEIAAFLQTKAPHSVYSFFYRSVEKGSDSMEWILSSAKLNRCDKGLPKEIVIFSYSLELIGDIKRRLYDVLENEGFFKENFSKVSLLTRREKEIAGLIAAGSTSQEIADGLHISVHTVNTHRKNINDKLSVQKFSELLKFAYVFDFATTDNET